MLTCLTKEDSYIYYVMHEETSFLQLSRFFCICLYVINLIKHVGVSLFKEDFELFWYIVGMDLWFSFENTVLYFLSGIIVMELLFTNIKNMQSHSFHTLYPFFVTGVRI